MIYVCSDIHGCMARYQEVLNVINEDDYLYILGDVIDRGENGIEILIDILNRDNITVLMGNHEFMMYQALVAKKRLELFNWIHPQNGGKTTLKKYQQLDDQTKERLLDLLKNMPLYITINFNNKNYYLSHGTYLPIENIENPIIENINIQSAFKIVWDSPFTNQALIKDYCHFDVYLHGHKFVQRFTGLDNYQAMIWNTVDKDGRAIDIIDLDGGCACIGNSHVKTTSLILYNLSTDSYQYFFSLDSEK